MAKSIKKPEPETVHVANISPAAMKVILAKVKATKDPGGPHEDPDFFAKAPYNFDQSPGFMKFSRPGDTTNTITIQGGGFKVTAESVKAIEGQ